MFGKLLYAVGLLGNKLLIVKVFTDQDIGHRQEKGHIRSWFNGMPFIGQSSRLGKTGIQNHQFAAFPHGGHHIDTVRSHQGLEPVGTSHDDIFAVKHVRNRNLTEGVKKGPVSTKQAVGFMGNYIVRAKNVSKSVDECGLEIGARHKQHSTAGVFVTDPLQLLSCVVQGLIPGKTLPFSFPSRPFPEQRVFQSVRVIELLDPCIAPGT